MRSATINNRKVSATQIIARECRWKICRATFIISWSTYRPRSSSARNAKYNSASNDEQKYPAYRVPATENRCSWYLKDEKCGAVMRPSTYTGNRVFKNALWSRWWNQADCTTFSPIWTIAFMKIFITSAGYVSALKMNWKERKTKGMNAQIYSFYVRCAMHFSVARMECNVEFFFRNWLFRFHILNWFSFSTLIFLLYSFSLVLCRWLSIRTVFWWILVGPISSMLENEKTATSLREFTIQPISISIWERVRDGVGSSLVYFWYGLLYSKRSCRALIEFCR